MSSIRGSDFGDYLSTFSFLASLLSRVVVVICFLLIVPSSSSLSDTPAVAAFSHRHSLLLDGVAAEGSVRHANVKALAQFTRLHPAANRGLLHELIFAVAQRNSLQLEEELLKVSDPLRTETYGKHWTKTQIAELTGNAEGTAHVLSFLNEHKTSGVRVSDQTTDGGYIVAEAPVEVWEALLDCQFYFYQRKNRPDVPSVIRAEKYTIPRALSQHLFSILGATNLDLPNKRLQLPASYDTLDTQPAGDDIYSGLPLTDDVNAPAQKTPRPRPRPPPPPPPPPQAPPPKLTENYVTPELINDLYSVVANSHYDTHSLASQGVYENIGQNYSPDDLEKFQKNFGLPTRRVYRDYQAHNSSRECFRKPQSCAEANLDVQYLMAISPNIKTVFDFDNSSYFLAVWAMHMSNRTSPTLVTSVSYGQDEETMSPDVVQVFDYEVMKLGLLGITVIVASGDDGANGAIICEQFQQCDGAYHPVWPATSPFIISVGATAGPELQRPEVVAQSDNGGQVTSGGGFSMLYKAPSFQSNALETYFATAPQYTAPEPGYNTTTRGYPDVAALGHSYLVVVGDHWLPVSGTSASAPVFSAMVSIINALRLAKAKDPSNTSPLQPLSFTSPLGWLTPALYNLGAPQLGVFNDITSGDNLCCAQRNPPVQPLCCPTGFYATPGWDPVSGLGSPNFLALSKYLLQMPFAYEYVNQSTNSTSSGTHRGPAGNFSFGVGPTIAPTVLPAAWGSNKLPSGPLVELFVTLQLKNLTFLSYCKTPHNYNKALLSALLASLPSLTESYVTGLAVALDLTASVPAPAPAPVGDSTDADAEGADEEADSASASKKKNAPHPQPIRPVIAPPSAPRLQLGSVHLTFLVTAPADSSHTYSFYSNALQAAVKTGGSFNTFVHQFGLKDNAPGLLNAQAGTLSILNLSPGGLTGPLTTASIGAVSMSDGEVAGLTAAFVLLAVICFCSGSYLPLQKMLLTARTKSSSTKSSPECSPEVGLAMTAVAATTSPSALGSPPGGLFSSPAATRRDSIPNPLHSPEQTARL